jgi:hypothetical protein
MKLTNKFKLKLEKYATKLSGEHIKIKYDIIFNNYIGWTPWRGPYHYSTIFLNKEWVLKQKTLAPIYGAIAHEIGHMKSIKSSSDFKRKIDMEYKAHLWAICNTQEQVIICLLAYIKLWSERKDKRSSYYRAALKFKNKHPLLYNKAMELNSAELVS